MKTDALPDIAIRVTGLHKTYAATAQAPSKTALSGIELALPRGRLFGLLGPNGAGKSTLINVLAGLVIKTQGQVEVWGFNADDNPRQARASIGVMPQEIMVDPFFTPYEALEQQAGLYGVRKAERRTTEILRAIDLADKAKAYARSLSGGMRRRLMLGKAMVHSPPILILDEPTAGVDVELRKQLWALVRNLNEQGVTIVLTTHYLEEAQALCDEIAIIHEGQLIAHDATSRLLARIDNKTFVLRPQTPLKTLPKKLTQNTHVKTQQRADGEVSITYNPHHINAQDVLELIAAAGITIADLRIEGSELENVFMQLTASQ